MKNQKVVKSYTNYIGYIDRFEVFIYLFFLSRIYMFVVDPFKLCGIRLGVDHVYSHIIAEEK